MKRVLHSLVAFSAFGVLLTGFLSPSPAGAVLPSPAFEDGLGCAVSSPSFARSNAADSSGTKWVVPTAKFHGNCKSSGLVFDIALLGDNESSGMGDASGTAVLSHLMFPASDIKSAGVAFAESFQRIAVQPAPGSGLSASATSDDGLVAYNWTNPNSLEPFNPCLYSPVVPYEGYGAPTRGWNYYYTLVTIWYDDPNDDPDQGLIILDSLLWGGALDGGDRYLACNG